MHYLRYRSNMTCLESCSVCAFTPITLAACRHDSNCHAHATDTRSSDLIPAITILGCLVFILRTLNLKLWHYFVADGPFLQRARKMHTYTPCLLCWPWWSWVSAGGCWRLGWQEQPSPPAPSPDTGQWRAKLAGWSARHNTHTHHQQSTPTSVDTHKSETSKLSIYGSNELNLVLE